ncbi:hypothetical protein JCM11491_001107 [Sporobolomyces phaffii]
MDDSEEPCAAILTNSPALHALKRAQLVQLSKQFGLKANGKNVELIERLKQHGRVLVLAKDAGDDTTTDWSLVESRDEVPNQSHLAEFGVQPDQGASELARSGSNSSLASTIKSAGTAVLNKLARGVTATTTTTRTAAASIYPSLQDAFERYPAASPDKYVADQTLDDFDHSVEGAIRRVTTHTTVDTTMRDDDDDDDKVSPAVSPAARPPPAFVFGSPMPTTSRFDFSMTMPGSLLSLSTTSSSSGEVTSTSMTGKRASILEEMNRRAHESRIDAEKRGIKLGHASLTRTKSSSSFSFEKGSKTAQVFEGKHKRAFDKMESIANHYAAKRPTTTLAKSSSSRTLDDASTREERPLKRTKPSTTLVSTLRDSGWMSTPPTRATMDAPTASSPKRRLELAKARRKSRGSEHDVPRRKRPSTVVGPAKPPSGSVSSASSFLKSTLKRFTTASSSAGTVVGPPGAQHRPPPPPPATPAQVPRFAVATAASASRVVAPSSLTSSSSSSFRKGRVEPGWKKFDLQESLKRPMTWKSRLGALFFCFVCFESGRADGESLLCSVGTSTPAKPPPPSQVVGPEPSERDVASKLASLPAAPTTPFTNVSNTAPATTATAGRPEPAAAVPRKHVSSASQRARSGKLQLGGGGAGAARSIEGLESRAKKIRAVRKATSSTSRG